MKLYSTTKKKGVILLMRGLVVGLVVGLLWLIGIKRDFILAEIFNRTADLQPNLIHVAEATQFSFDVHVDGKVFYTLDGSVPTVESRRYDPAEQFEIDATTVVRYAVFAGDERLGNEKSQTVFVGDEHSLAIASLITSPANLWDAEKGIYTEENYENTGEEWEREGVFQYFEPGYEHVLTRDVGLRIHGGGSRSLPQKSWRINFPDTEPLNYQIFPGKETAIFSSLILRNAGADADQAFMRDVLTQRLADQATDLDTQAARPVVVYVNGEYFGLYYLRERQTLDYLGYGYSVPDSRMAMVEIPHDFGENRGDVVAYKGDADSSVERFNHIVNDFRRCDDCFNYGTFASFFDVDNYIDYLIFQTHVANYDWPYGNYRAWRYLIPEFDGEAPKGLDGRFRFLLFDLDVGLGFGSKTEEDMRAAAESEIFGRLIDNRFPFRGSFYNDEFMKQHMVRYADLLNTIFSPAHMRQEIDALEAEILPEIPRQIARWGGVEDEYGNSYPSSVEEWLGYVDLLRVYGDYRAEAVFENLPEELDIDEAVVVRVRHNQDQGQVRLNSINELEADFEGKYFAEYPIRLQATAKAGYRFSHWENLPHEYRDKSEQDSLSLSLRKDTNIQAVFEVE